jgi:membrane-associated phospholipid phosphatase
VSRRSGALAAAFATLAVLVATGAVSAIDQWSIDHLMSSLGDDTMTRTEAVVPLLGATWHTPLDVVANLVTLPAQAIVGSAVVAGCCIALARRRQMRAALAWGAVWLAANAVEVLCKAVLDRPLLHEGGDLVYGFQSSWPSGHSLRSVFIAMLAASIWPRATWWVAAWAAAVLVLLEVDGFHVPTDIAGGLLLALLAADIARRKAAG